MADQVPERCWASAVTPCGGGLTKEHLISRVLMEDRVTIRGMSWCREAFKTIGISSLVCKCLCADHNSALSPCDVEAKRVKDAIQWMRTDLQPDDGYSKVIPLNGLRFARWLAKTACDSQASESKHIPELLARYAFAETDDPRVGVYLPVNMGDSLAVNADHIGMYWLHSEAGPDEVLVCFNFYGMPFVIGTTPIEGAEGLIAEQFGVKHPGDARWIDRLKTIELTKMIPGFGPVTKGRIRFLW